MTATILTVDAICYTYSDSFADCTEFVMAGTEIDGEEEALRGEYLF